MRNFLRRVQDEKKRRRVLLFALLKFTSLALSLSLSLLSGCMHGKAAPHSYFHLREILHVQERRKN
jgi:hypothetical protein